MTALMVRIRPGAFFEYQGAALVLSTLPAAKDSRQPADTPLRKILSGRMLPFLTPARDTISMVSAGVYELKLIAAMMKKYNQKAQREMAHESQTQRCIPGEAAASGRSLGTAIWARA